MNERGLFAQQYDVSRETMAAVDQYVDLLLLENENQNLIARPTVAHLWHRHVGDSAQLLRFAPSVHNWIDLGSGAGFPGIIIALLSQARVLLVEERHRRADFLRGVVEALNLGDRCEVREMRAERIEPQFFDAICARAFAPLEKLLEIGSRFAGPETIWILPKGRSAQTELDAALASWQGEFRLEPSLTDPDARIIVAQQVRRRQKGKR